MNTIDANSLLLQMRALAARAHGLETPAVGETQKTTDFNGLLKNAVNAVNEQQISAQTLAADFERGDPQVDVAQVMVAMQKANVSFQAMTQVRNRLVSAYQDIMNMPI
ncbi:MAG: flagellar hook-basal body complex protein FliE [Gammaproteobacteria bacterium]|nr:flagellar hook-basal body complex protein FliE [Gammaproteobacteria bacterium]MBI5615832.1 flagellar hook-basal body complex protein FliE [Gammaproteobacteria bacterium]